MTESGRLQRDQRAKNEDQSQRESAPRWVARFGEWIIDHPLPAVSLGGLILYTILRRSALIFYGQLGANPEEVGLGYAETLAQSIIGVAFLVIVLTLIALTVMAVLPARWKALLGPKGWLGVLVIGTLLVLSVYLPWRAHSDAGRVINGYPVHLTEFSPVPLSAEVSRVFFTQSIDLPTIDSYQCVIFLGTHDGVSLLWEPGEGITWRVPTSSVVVAVGGELAGFGPIVPFEDC